MHIHTQPVHQLILFLFKDFMLLTLTQREGPQLQFCPSLPPLGGWVTGHREDCHHLGSGGTLDIRLVSF